MIVDHELSPSQARNLERATGAQVLDRTGVIVEIFHRHAKSREARSRSRSRGSTTSRRACASRRAASERQQGAGRGRVRARARSPQDPRPHRRAEGGARGDPARAATTRRSRAPRSAARRARRLHQRGQVVADARAHGQRGAGRRQALRHARHHGARAAAETKPRVLVSDTVGFIKKLPHDLVASFRSTLDEALEASLLLYVVDASDPTCEAQLEVTPQRARARSARTRCPSRLLLNKIDRLERGRSRRAAREASRRDPALRASRRGRGRAARDHHRLLRSLDGRGRARDALREAGAARRSATRTRGCSPKSTTTTGRIMKVRGLPAAIARLRRTLAAS